MRFNINGISIPVLLLSFCFAVGAWYAITVNNRIDMQLVAKLDYNNLPKNLIITDGLVHEVSVHVRGPKTLLQSFDPRKPYMIDLSSLQKGKNIVPFLQPDMSAHNFRAYEILDISPPQAIIFTDTLLERNVPIKPQITTILHSSAFKIKDLKISPNTALLRGPEKAISKVDSIPLELPMDTTEGQGIYTKKAPLVTVIPQTSVTPALVDVTYTVDSARVQMKLKKKVTINGEHRAYSVSPASLEVHVELPEALQKNKSYLQGLSVRVTPPLLESGQSATVQSTVHLPEGMTLVETPTQEFTITRLP